MSNRIEAPGHTALWTEAALRALAGTAFLCDQDGDASQPHEPMTADYARIIALDAMAIATAFERACEEHAPRADTPRPVAKKFTLQHGAQQLRCDGCGSFVFRFFHDDHSSCDVCGRECMYGDGVTALPLPPGAETPAPTPTGGEERA